MIKFKIQNSKFKILIAFWCTVLLFAGQVTLSDAFAASVGDRAPNFVLKDMTGTDISLYRFKGKVVFINFWATWCPPCKYELRYLNELQNKNKDVVVLAININKDRSDCAKFLGKNPVNVIILLDPDGNTVNAFKGKAMPVSYILDKDGTIRYIHFGFNENKDPQLWEKEIKELNGGKI